MEFVYVNKPTRKSFVDLEGKKVGMLTVLGWAGMHGKENKWWCQCSCEARTVLSVNSSSLQKGLTLSCGCLRKRHTTALSTEEAQTYIDSRYVLLEYVGMKHPCKVSCAICGDTVEHGSFYSLRNSGIVCSCKETVKEDKHKGIIEQAGYTFVHYLNNRKYVKIKCNQCGVERKSNPLNIPECPCTKAENMTADAYCVYLLHDTKTSGVYKVGISNNVRNRVADLNKQPLHKFSVLKEWWVKDISTAYAIESYLHDNPKFEHIYKDGEFDGATEVFKYEGDILEEMAKYQDTLTLVKASLSRLLPDINKAYTHSIEYNGKWYPYPYMLGEDVGKSWDTIRGHIRKGKSLEEAISFEYEHVCNKYEYDGQLLTAREIYDKYGGDSYKNLKERLKRGMPVEKAINQPRATRYYILDGRKLGVKELCEHLKAPTRRVLKRMYQRGMTLEQALKDVGVDAAPVPVRD